MATAYGHRTGRCADPVRTTVIPVPDDLDPLLVVYLAHKGPICVNGLVHAAAALAGPDASLDAASVTATCLSQVPASSGI